MHYEQHRDAYVISTDQSLLDRPTIHAFLAQTYWSPGVPREIVDRALDNSCVFGMYRDGEQVGLARVITDYATFAYIADVFILPAFRGQGLGVWLIEVVLSHPDLQGFRRWMLATLDAHDLYRKHGFEPLSNPERFMEIRRTDVHGPPTTDHRPSQTEQ
jgi:GNAT superfamily N-acetyltransferase